MGNAAVRFEKVFWDTGKWTEKQQENGLSCTTIIIILEHFHSLQKETSRLLAVIHKYCPPGSPVYYQDSIVENNRNLLS